MPVEKLNIPRREILLMAAKVTAVVAGGGGGGLIWAVNDELSQMEEERRNMEAKGIKPDPDVPIDERLNIDGYTYNTPSELTMERHKRREQLEKKRFIGAVMGLLGSFGLLVLLTSDTQETEVDSL